MEIKEIRRKRPWGKIMPDATYMCRGAVDLNNMWNAEVKESKPLYKIVTQDDMLREYYPSGHLINSDEFYPDIHMEEEYDIVNEAGMPTGQTGKKHYVQHVPRYAFAFQQIIAIKHIIHLCGNDIQFDLTKTKLTDDEEQNVTDFRCGWLKKNQEIAFYEAVKAYKIVADAAYVGYLDNGKYRWQVLSYKEDGSRLYPHYSKDGRLELFAREFSDLDEDNKEVTRWLEVWDDTYYYLYKQAKAGIKGAVNKVKEIVGIEGYELGEKKEHGFPFIPVTYIRSKDGACWSPAQDSIDGYELAFSEMAQNNYAFGTPAMYIQGEDAETIRDMNGTLRYLTLGKDDKAGYLEGQSASESYQKQLDITYRMIYKQAHAVETPQISGNSDISGAAIKILYADATEQATIDAAEFQPFLDDMFRIFAFGYGVETKNVIDYQSMPLTPWIKPFVHVNESSVVNDLATAVGSGFLSKQTASERASFYGNADEYERIIREAKENQEADLLYQLQDKQNKQNE